MDKRKIQQFLEYNMIIDAEGEIWKKYLWSIHKIVSIVNLQVFFQPLVLLGEKLQAELEIEINLSGKGDDVRWPQVPAADTHC